jgi:hypothetical protein
MEKWIEDASMGAALVAEASTGSVREDCKRGRRRGSDLTREEYDIHTDDKPYY